MKRKLLAVLLAGCLALGLLAGCSATGVQNYDGSDEPTATAAPEATETPAATVTHDFAAARAAYPLDTVVMTVDDTDVSWGELFYWLYYSVTSVEQYIGTVSDFSQPCSFDDSQTYAQFFLSDALSMVTQYHALDANARALGAEISEEDEASLQDILDSDIVTCVGDDGTEEEFYDYLDGLYVSPELYNYINSVSVLYTNAFNQLYGADGSAVSDEETTAFADANGYMTAKNILISTQDAEGEDLSDEEKAEKLATAQEIADQLAAETDTDARIALFDELSAQYNDDTGAAYYPDGYCFASGDMVDEFYDAAEALGEYEVSAPVESDYGYHIIMRMPRTPDDVVEYYSEDEQYTLRYMAAQDAYSTQTQSWIDDAQVVWQPDFENFDIAPLFAQ